MEAILLDFLPRHAGFRFQALGSPEAKEKEFCDRVGLRLPFPSATLNWRLIWPRPQRHSNTSLIPSLHPPVLGSRGKR